MTPWERWEKSTITNQANVVLAAFICFMTVVNIVLSIVQSRSQDAQVREIKTAITEGIGTAKTTIEGILVQNREATTTALSENRHTLEQSLRSIHADAQEGLRATLKQGKEALDASINASRTDLRAWVSITGIMMQDTTLGREFIHVGVIIKNSGRTPARKVRFTETTFTWQAAGEPDSGRQLPVSLEIALGPDTTYMYHLRISPISPEERTRDLASLVAETATFTVRGVITYFDVFENIVRRTGYCGTYHHNQRPLLQSCADGSLTFIE